MNLGAKHCNISTFSAVKTQSSSNFKGLQIFRSSELHFKLFPLCHFRDVGLGDVVTVGQCRPLSKTVRFNVLKVSKGKGSKDKKQFEKF